MAGSNTGIAESATHGPAARFSVTSSSSVSDRDDVTGAVSPDSGWRENKVKKSGHEQTYLRFARISHEIRVMILSAIEQ